MYGKKCFLIFVFSSGTTLENNKEIFTVDYKEIWRKYDTDVSISSEKTCTNTLFSFHKGECSVPINA